MSVARWSGLDAATASSTADGFSARYWRPRSSRAPSVSTQSPSASDSGPSTTMTFSTSLIWSRRSRSLATWVSSSATTNREPESATMNATSSPSVVGYTVVVAPPAHITAKSARIHSIRVEHAIATRSSVARPSASSPAARRATRSPVSPQLSSAHPGPDG